MTVGTWQQLAPLTRPPAVSRSGLLLPCLAGADVVLLVGFVMAIALAANATLLRSIRALLWLDAVWNAVAGAHSWVMMLLVATMRQVNLYDVARPVLILDW